MVRMRVEYCVDKVPNRFELILLTVHRARAITDGPVKLPWTLTTTSAAKWRNHEGYLPRAAKILRRAQPPRSLGYRVRRYLGVARIDFSCDTGKSAGNRRSPVMTRANTPFANGNFPLAPMAGPRVLTARCTISGAVASLPSII